MPRVSEVAACDGAAREVPGRRRARGRAGAGGRAGLRCRLPAMLLVLVAAPAQAQVAGPAGLGDAVAVAAFANITGAAEDEWIGFGIAETITADLAGSGAVAVVGNDAVEAALRQARVERGAAVDLSDTPAVQAGRTLGARWVISGGFQRLGRQVRLTARIVDVATAAVQHATTVDGMLDDLFDLQDRLSADLRGGLSASSPAMAANAPSPGVAPFGMGRPAHGATRWPTISPWRRAARRSVGRAEDRPRGRAAALRSLRRVAEGPAMRAAVLRSPRRVVTQPRGRAAGRPSRRRAAMPRARAAALRSPCRAAARSGGSGGRPSATRPAPAPRRSVPPASRGRRPASSTVPRRPSPPRRWLAMPRAG